MKVKILSKNGSTDILIDGKSVANRCLAFRIESDGPGRPTLTLTYLCDEIEFEGDNVQVEPG